MGERFRTQHLKAILVALVVGLVLVTLRWCPSEGLYVENATVHPIEVRVPYRLPVKVRAKSHEATFMNLREGSLDISVTVGDRKQRVTCKVPPGSDILEVTVYDDERISCGGT